MDIKCSGYLGQTRVLIPRAFHQSCMRQRQTGLRTTQFENTLALHKTVLSARSDWFPDSLRMSSKGHVPWTDGFLNDIIEINAILSPRSNWVPDSIHTFCRKVTYHGQTGWQTTQFENTLTRNISVKLDSGFHWHGRNDRQVIKQQQILQP